MLAMVATMAEGAPGVARGRAVGEAAWMPVVPEWRRLYWAARERAEAAEERAEELKRAELDARCEALRVATVGRHAIPGH